ncbi:hypothetical protein ACFOW1_11795 [Parasediminibacterium paludis]|uniref:Uncharacterized protein n=1 Tax=Parasediminibacterium paludis TaxID=908966 RepID=A0ABV8PZB7_9BACT
MIILINKYGQSMIDAGNSNSFNPMPPPFVLWWIFSAPQTTKKRPKQTPQNI